MNETAVKTKINGLLSNADIRINGSQPWDIRIHDDRFYQRVMRAPSLGIGESYMDAWWDCDRLDEFFFRALRSADLTQIYGVWTLLRFVIVNYFSNQQSRFRSKRVAKKHYNLGNELYRYMLGETMAYTCGYWKNAQTLDEAKYAKYD